MITLHVRRIQLSNEHDFSFDLLDDANQPVPAVSGFMRHLRARGCSPNTLSAYVYDLQHFMLFLTRQNLTYHEFTPPQALFFLEYLSSLSSHKQVRRLGLVLATTSLAGQSTTHLSPATINRIFAAVSSFYEYLILAGLFEQRENPITKVADPALARVSERHRPFMGYASHQKPMRRTVHVKMVRRLPRPIDDEIVSKLLDSLKLKRDKAMFLLMLHGGLRPGEVLNLHLSDIQYGRKRVVILYREDHPKGVRTKSRTERVVDLLLPATLKAVSDYVMFERPADTQIPYVFLVGGGGKRRAEALGYHALVKLFARHCDRLDIRNPWLTPHALRHTHATRMFEQGMRELTLQKRLGHVSPASTQVYTRVSDAVVIEEYRRVLGKAVVE